MIKGYCTENGIEVASTGMQVHGGMGYVEETGAAQTLRDVRITAIYEGTTGIQSNDLIGRKIGRDRGAALRVLLDEMQTSLGRLSATRPWRCRCAMRRRMRWRGCGKSTDVAARGARQFAGSRHGRVRALPQALRLGHGRLADGARRRHRRATSSPKGPATANSWRPSWPARISTPRSCCHRCWRSSTSWPTAARRSWEPTLR